MKPLILDFKETRTEDLSFVGYNYDEKKSLNVLNIDGQLKPFIDVASSDLELATKTKIQRESDDSHYIHELGTKTEVKRERDDYSNGLLELATKTFVKSESDD